MNVAVNSAKTAPQAKMKTTLLTVVNAVTADLVKVNGGGSLVYYKANIGKYWDLSKPTALQFVAVIEKKFAQNNKFHGYFDPKKHHMAPGTLRDFVETRISFDDMVTAFVNSSCEQANLPGRGSLALGHLVMVHYKTTDDAYDSGRFMAVLVGDQGGFEFDTDLQPVDLTSINTSELRHAAMFDLTLFYETFPKNDGDPYLKFITGKSKSTFLRDAFGCGNYIPNKNSVEQVNQAVRDFLDDPAIPTERRLFIVKKVTSYMEAAAKNRIPVSVAEIQDVISESLPAKSDKRNKFSEFVNEGEYTISEHFQPTRSGAALFSNIDIADPEGKYKCTVNLGAISYENNKTDCSVTVDKNLDLIKIPITPSAREEIKKILGEE